MAFTQETFAPVGANSADAVAVYSYRTTDDLATIQGTAYFAEKVFTLEEGDMILCAASDGAGFGVVQSDKETIAIGV